MPEGPAERLLDAQVAYHLERLTAPRLVEAVLDGVGDRPLRDLVDRQVIADAVERALTTPPDDAVVGAFLEAVLATVRGVVRDGPAEPFPLADVVDREQVEALLDVLLDLTPALERALDRLTTSPLVGVMAGQFMGRIIGEVVQANQAVANRVPGLGSLVSLGLSAASGMVGAADKQLEGLLGDTVGKGGTFAVRRLNAVLLETLRDPTTRAAALQVWDLVAAEPIRGLDDRASADEVAAVADAVRDLVVSTVAHPHTVAFAHAVVDGLYEQHGDHTLADLHLDGLALPLLDALRESGALERWLRAELEPFYRSEAVAAVMSGLPG